MKLISSLLFLIIFSSCYRSDDLAGETPKEINDFTLYTIPENQHYSNSSSYVPVETDELNFSVKFDSSAIYSTIDPSNQYDINKLYGFSDNNAQHHLFSARIGWRWSDNKLRLFGYIYNGGEVSFLELTDISIGEIHNCSIKITPLSYVFSVNGLVKTMPRSSTSVKAHGYKLFPYFGGDETAPHEIHIWIKEK